MKNVLRTLVLSLQAAMLTLAALTGVSCEKQPPLEDPEDPGRVARRTMIMCSFGYNNLSRYLRDDLDDLCSGFVPKKNSESNLFLLTHTTAAYGDYKTPTSPYLVRVTCNNIGQIVKDTLVRYPEGSDFLVPEQLEDALTYIRDRFPSEKYGMVLSSHSTGWLPERAYDGRSANRFSLDRSMQVSNFFHDGFRPRHEREILPDVKSIGATYHNTFRTRNEMELTDFVASVPMQLDYMIFDSCLMGGIEVAYEFKDKCSFMVFSPTQVLAEGFRYETMTEALLQGENPDVVRVAREYFDQYRNATANRQSATVAAIDCSKLTELGEVCRNIFGKYRGNIDKINPSTVQNMDYQSPWFFDMGDIADSLKMEKEDSLAFHAALDRCILYKAATPRFLNKPIVTYSGLTMFLPPAYGHELDDTYRKLKWNQATEYVK